MCFIVIPEHLRRGGWHSRKRSLLICTVFFLNIYVNLLDCSNARPHTACTLGTQDRCIPLCVPIMCYCFIAAIRPT